MIALGWGIWYANTNASVSPKIQLPSPDAVTLAFVISRGNLGSGTGRLSGLPPWHAL